MWRKPSSAQHVTLCSCNYTKAAAGWRKQQLCFLSGQIEWAWQSVERGVGIGATNQDTESLFTTTNETITWTELSPLTLVECVSLVHIPVWCTFQFGEGSSLVHVPV